MCCFMNNGLHNPTEFGECRKMTPRDSKNKTVFFQTCIEIPGGSEKNKLDRPIRVVLKRQFAAFYSLVVCEFFRQTETP
jgi:hypothetical protein